MGLLARVMSREPMRTRGRSLEDPAVPLSEWNGAFGGKSTKAGVDVGPEEACTVAAFYRGVRLISREVARLPLKVYEKRDGVEGWYPSREHPAYALLHRAPNEYMTPFVFKQLLMTHVLVHGNGYAAIERDGMGRPTALLPLDPRPEVTFPVRVNGRLWLIVNHGQQAETKIAAGDYLHFIGFTWDGLAGVSVVRYAAESLGLSIAAERYGSVFFDKGATPRIILRHPGHLSPEAAARLASNFDKLHSGLDNAHSTGVLEEGMEVETVSLSAKDSQLLEARQFQVREVALWLGLPPHKLGDASKVAYNSLEQENQSYLSESIDPWLVMSEQEYSAKLLTEREKAGDTHTVEYIRQAMLNTDLDARTRFYTAAFERGIMSPDEIRARENLNPIPGGAGSRYWRPMNLAPLDQVNNPTDPPTDTAPDPDAGNERNDAGAGETPETFEEIQEWIRENIRAAQSAEDVDDFNGMRRAYAELVRAQFEGGARAAVEDAAGRIARRLHRSATRAAKDPERFLERLNGWGEQHAGAVGEILAPVLRLGDAMRAEVDPLDVDAIAGHVVGEHREVLLRAAGEARPSELAGVVAALEESAIQQHVIREVLGDE